MTDYPAHVEAEAARLVELVSGADPGTPVPTCPGWTLAELITHVGTTHRWVIHILRDRVQERIWSRQVPNGLPEGASGDPAWLARGAAELVATLRATDPATRVWSWGGDQSAAYWARRMAFELLVHRADAELALGADPAIPAATALDGIEELLGNLPHAVWVARRLAELDAEGATIHLHATDTPPAAKDLPEGAGEWTVVQGAAGTVAWTRGHTKADTAVRGPARDLLLMLYGRRFAPTLTVVGDRSVLDRWLAKAAF
ncbi:maleylpyruvate isomerase family mycothiol-dependent enzyme [Nonomuraea sp. 3-1Str]|uniref:maleylpyruvate isomerase family mycothiol-dependent enzyme n=1 Tax=Nonomuraea sp. 3-1Str TaxID=2929801 RepID=UPI002862A39F|nr:maleylpyruvate isomerase family mycothiol-dependent enzyme [Nonomuraea sp. 3-1Str]MDR8410811.1 maleylpyruvate isomerase family mycothiol-dependent enzyme [Nonomuraea sp. 3-1Str]